MWPRHHVVVPVAVIDVGSNTARLHVARGSEALYRERAMLRLGESIELTGAIPEGKLVETTECVAGFARQARLHGAERIEVLVTSPGRQAANGEDLLGRLAGATGAPVRLLSAVEEGRLGFLGAVSAVGGSTRRTIAVCDVGGGSTQIAVGNRREGATWVRSIDLGSMRLTSRMLLTDDPPGGRRGQRGPRTEVERQLADITPRRPRSHSQSEAARALRNIVGVEARGERTSTTSSASSRAHRPRRSSSSTASTASASAPSRQERSSSRCSASGSAFRCGSPAAACVRGCGHRARSPPRSGLELGRPRPRPDRVRARSATVVAGAAFRKCVVDC